MVQIEKHPEGVIVVRVELFGQARLVIGRRSVEVAVSSNSGASDLAYALAERFPDLVGKAIRADRRGLLESYTCNLNGIEFINDHDKLDLTSNDIILLFSSQAGG